MTEAQLKDKILSFLRDSQSPTKVENVAAIATYIDLDYEPTERLCVQIKDDKNIIHTYGANQTSACKIRHKGITFLERGGYEQQETIEQLRKGRAETKEDLEIQQLKSVIATNVATQNAYDTQRKQNRTSIILVATATILSLATLIKEFFPQPPQIDQQTKQLLQRQVVIQDSLQQNLRRMDSTFRSISDSLKS